MNPNPKSISSPRTAPKNRLPLYAATCFLALGTLTPLRAQDVTATPAPPLMAGLVAPNMTPDSLPNAPSFVASSESSSSSAEDSPPSQPAQPSPRPHDIATIHTKIIQPGMVAPHLTPGDKVLLGLANATSPRAAFSWVAASTYEQIFNTAPNYGQTAKGYFQRLGASAARDSSETIFGDSVLAPILHEDPRYYRLGPSHNFFDRVFYAATRAVVTRTDSGKPTPNFSLVGGNLAGAALTQAYYPAINTGLGPTMRTFGTSIGGSAVGFVFDEFLRDGLTFLHHGHAE